jgi:hypothetical protein
MILSMNMEQRMCGFNKMVQQPTHLVLHSEFSEKCFLGMFSACVAAAFPRFDPVRFSLGLPQSQVYQNRPQTLEGVKEAITQECCHSARNDPQGHGEVPGGLNQCIDNEGRHLSD